MHLLITLYVLHDADEQLAKLIIQLSNDHILLAQTSLFAMANLPLHLNLIHIV